MKNYINDKDMLAGPDMSLAQDVAGENHLSSLSPRKQREIIKGTHTTSSKEELHRYINNSMEEF